LFADVLAGTVSDVQFAEKLCSKQRMGLPLTHWEREHQCRLRWKMTRFPKDLRLSGPERQYDRPPAFWRLLSLLEKLQFPKALKRRSTAALSRAVAIHRLLIGSIRVRKSVGVCPMPMPGLSLVGFMDWPQAANHLRLACVPADPSDTAIGALWQAGRAKLGAPIPRAGSPDIQPWPTAHQAHVNSLISGAETGFDFLPGQSLHGASFHLIEIDPLLAYQHVVVTEMVTSHSQPLGQPPTMEQLLDVCLPLSRPQEVRRESFTPSSIALKSSSLNLRITAGGVFGFKAQGQSSPQSPTFSRDFPVVGIAIGPGAPLVHVVRHKGKCLLHNGYHRAYGARMAGATHIPCILRDVPNYAAAGVREDGATFGSALLESANPPTMGHFTQGRALDVHIRRVSRVIALNWAEHAIAEE